MDRLTYLMPEQLHESPFNPRQTYDEAALAELTHSVAKQGILQPIVVRRCAVRGPHQFEVVFGHRRLRAAVRAELVTVPCIVHEDMTDEDAAVAQIHENLKRADVHPVEEADGYVRLMSDHQLSVARLVELTGKTSAYIYARLKLAQLGDTARQACLAGRFGAEIGLLIARYCRRPELEQRAVQLVTPLGEGGERQALPYRKARDVLRENFCISLKEAPFNRADAQLKPHVGPCTTCSKRAGSDAGLADDSDADVCTDKACYDGKVAAHAFAIELKLRADGHTVISGDAARELMPRRYGWPTGYQPLGVVIGETESGDGVTAEQRLAQLSAPSPKPVYIVNPHDGGARAYLTDAQVEQMEEEFQAEQKAKFGGTPPGPAARPAFSLRHAVPENRPLIEQAVADGPPWVRVLRHVLGTLRGRERSVDELRFLVLREISMADAVEDLVVQAMGWEADMEADDGGDLDDFLRAKLATLTAADMGALLVMVALSNDHCSVADRLAMVRSYGLKDAAIIKLAGLEPDAEPDRDPNTADMFAGAEA